jgi:DNA segregation ATPase FtsK/SpoIIIE, S-DNA-T family
LRKQEESFSFSTSDEPKGASADKLFADILREGPAMGIHVLAWCDTPASVERTLDRSSLREFDHRVLFQMSANDSSNLIDSPAANKLGFHRALAYSEEAGVMEKFRPYALPGKAWLDQARTRLRARKAE